MARLINSDKFLSDKRKREKAEKKLQFSRHFKVPDFMSVLFYSEVRLKVERKIEDIETFYFKLLGLDK